MDRTLAGITLVAALLCLPGTAQAQIVAPAGRTLFNHGMMVRSVIRIDNFSEPVPGLRLRRITNPYAFIWGAHTNLSVSVVAPLESLLRVIRHSLLPALYLRDDPEDAVYP